MGVLLNLKVGGERNLYHVGKKISNLKGPNLIRQEQFFLKKNLRKQQLTHRRQPTHKFRKKKNRTNLTPNRAPHAIAYTQIQKK
jgi:hypothetical protein